MDIRLPGNENKYGVDNLTVEEIRAGFMKERRKLKKRMLAGNLTPKQRVAHTRRAKAIIRQYLVKAKKHANSVKSSSVPVGQKELVLKDSHLLDQIYPKRATKWLPTWRRSRKPSKDIDIGMLSFHTNPSETMRQLLKLVKADSKLMSVKVNYRDSVCEDVGPYLVLAAMYKSLNRIYSGGKITQSLSRLFDALEIDKQLSMKLNQKESLSFEISAFKIRSGTGRSKKNSATHLTDPQLISKTNRELIEEINRWLAIKKEELTLEGRRVVGKLVGETLDNAERHSETGLLQPDVGDWFVIGASVKFPGAQTHRILLSFLSVGNTISSSMDRCAAATRHKMEEYVSRHKATLKRHSVERLRTVFALQDGVTSRSDAFDERRGGTGFQDICEFFEGLALPQQKNSNANFTIVSGNTVIHLKSPYIKGSEKDGDERELWFNELNSSFEPPDESHVSYIDNPLGGTLLTMSFDLRPTLVEKDNGHNA